MLDTTKLITLAAEYGAALTPEQAERFDVYARLLVEWNEKMNLTAITDPEGMLVKHFVDSLTLAPFLPEGGFSLIDVGTGAGFPGVPVAILRPDCRLTLLDSLNKRLTFLETLCREVGVTATRVHARAEEGGRQAALRDRFDVATARAVAGLPLLCEYCLPFVKPGGRFLALKGPDGEAELVSAKKALIELKG
ncbi:MAG: 16S rRNA (guanine(527)-N(7))-methyltransferase RsmG, partial [Clostridia bacterium]|nr:16S rRNA (guanine(527)-N(7))-methyltransferase RsmG [Clostridia bacterium]